MKLMKPWQHFGRDTMLSKLEAFVGDYPNVMALIRTVSSVAAVGLLIYLNV